MSFAYLRNHALVTAAGLSVAITLPLAALTVLAPAAQAVPAKSSVATAIVPQTAAQKAAVKKAAAKKLVAKKTAAQVNRGKTVVKVAARYKGRPYRYGATGPWSFDCSGYTGYVVRKALHVKLPRTAAQQAHSGKIKKIQKSSRRIGDLVFFYGGGGIGHVGIYAGGGTMWNSPHSGANRPQAKNLVTVGFVRPHPLITPDVRTVRPPPRSSPATVR